jgi:FtsP/CotA-like multicopper oxidase with cupredoxin domain
MMKKEGIDRRKFLKLATVGLTGGYLGLKSASALAQRMGGGGMGGGGMGGGTTVINPPPGAPFMDPLIFPNESTEPGVVAVSLEARVAPINVNGKVANLLTYNGYYPAPTIKVRSGDKLRVNLRNDLSMLGTNILGHDRDITNLHTHGLHVSPSGNSDNMMVMLMSGETFTYDYDLSNQEPSSINFYHPHIHGSVAEQYWGGMAGALDVADDDEITVLSGFETHILFLKDISLSGSGPEPYNSMMDYMHGKEGNTIMVNGLVNPVLNIRPGQVQRWRIINASNARFFKLSLENHTLYVVGTEGGLLDRPYPMSSLVLSPGERADILVKANQTVKNYRLLSLPYNRGGGSMGQQVTLLTASCRGTRVNDGIPSTIDPSAVRINPAPVKSEQLYLSMGQGRGYINGISFEVLSDGTMKAAEIHSKLGTYEIWEIINQSGMDHPFHQHVNSCQVLSITGGDSGYASFYTTAPAWKDVVLIPKMGRAKILVPVMDYDGMAMFHCHIVEHEDIGMMGMWHIMGMGM